jgi:hypothetical protein
MAHAPIVQDRTARRTVKALGIVERQSCELLDSGAWVVTDTATGSGTPRTVAGGHCDCPDHTRRAAYCKHLQAVALEEAALRQFAADWDTRAEQARASVTAVAQVGVSCPDCGAPLKSAQFYTGGRGYRLWLVCSRDVEHRALRA